MPGAPAHVQVADGPVATGAPHIGLDPALADEDALRITRDPERQGGRGVGVSSRLLLVVVGGLDAAVL